MLLQVGCSADLLERYELVSQLVVHTTTIFKITIPARPTPISVRTVVVLAALKLVACHGSFAFACRWGHFSAGDASATQKLVDAKRSQPVSANHATMTLVHGSVKSSPDEMALWQVWKSWVNLELNDPAW